MSMLAWNYGIIQGRNGFRPCGCFNINIRMFLNRRPDYDILVAYKALLLVFTNYTPYDHFLVSMGRQTREILPGIKDIFPCQTEGFFSRLPPNH